MRWLSLFAILAMASTAFAQAEESAIPESEGIAAKSTHEQVALIKVTENEPSLTLNTFCLDKQGRILAGCKTAPKPDGMSEGVIRVHDADGKFLSSWKVPVNPEAINTAPDGSVLMAGDGKLFRFDSSGKMLKEAKSPHYDELKNGTETLRKEVIQQSKQQTLNYDAILKNYTARLEALKKKENPTATDKRMIAAYERNVATFKDAMEKANEQAEPSQEEVDRQVTAMIKAKSAFSSISSDGKNVFIATRALAGYGFAIWRTDLEFANGERIVTDLRGCCGQMDVQASPAGVYVAENSRHRVVCFDDSGKELLTWGKSDRKGLEGFSSCCNPMNVCFGSKGDVYTAESTSGRIKRFSAKGEFLDYVGDVNLVPGCKKVSIAVSDDADRVYMMDITRNHIILMKRKSADNTTARKS